MYAPGVLLGLCRVWVQARDSMSLDFVYRAVSVNYRNLSFTVPC